MTKKLTNSSTQSLPVGTSGEFRPHGFLLTPVLELDGSIGIGDEGRSI
jgi:hypothetical protein